ncbi:general transcription factor II-I repeat domain-containing protein 2B-like [Hydra vulgaris]|uniref:General transcription factor II-I repeat domain-containing protein 2B-like n=1 Tax=Hydra vulgaris TaxID=6087 RepID=A0ABM4CRR9_HYDVU
MKNNNISRYETVLDSLIAEFNDRFKDFEEHNETLKLAFQPHLIEISTTPEYLQIELIELSEDSILKSLFDNKKDPLEIWKTAVEYPKLRQIARRLLSCFGTTYCCESTFSHMTFIKSCFRSQWTDEHLEDKLKLKTTKIEPNIQVLVQKKQNQKSH